MEFLSKAIFLCVVVGLTSYELHVYFSRGKWIGPVETQSGKLRGTVQYSRSGRPFASFYGVPYAEPPVGQLRFTAPQPLRKWPGILVADTAGIECMHYEYILDLGIRGQEDCLILNVFTSAVKHVGTELEISSGQRLPVIVYIPGGGFMSGSSARYEGHYFMDEDVLLVTMNYRVGVLGFLNSGDSTIKGNMGLKDQLLALKWVRDNIGNFGGDPARVTLMGESAGAISAHLHMLTPKSAGLFQRAILMSGHALTPWAIKTQPALQAQKFAEKMGCSTLIPSEFLQCLRLLDARDIVATHAVHRYAIVEPYESYGPTLEAVEDDDAFITDHPKDTLVAGNYARIPLMLGVNDAEGLIWVARALTDTDLARRMKTLEGWREVLPRLLGNESLTANNVDKLTRFYFGVKSTDFNPLAYIENFTNLYSDHVFNKHIPQIIRSQVANASFPLYLYYYTYQGDFSLFKITTSVPRERLLPSWFYLGYSVAKEWMLKLLGKHERLPAGHADELPLLFNFGPFVSVGPQSEDYKMSREMIRALAQFAKASETLTLWDKIWTLASSERSSYLKIDLPEQSGMVIPPFEKRIRLWKEI